MTTGATARLQAIHALLPVLQSKASLNTSLPKAQRHLNTEDAALTQALAFGVCRFYPRLQFWAQQLLQRPFKAKDLDLHLVLLLGLYQLQEGRVANYAAVNTSVNLCKQLHKAWAGSLINACLRRFQREQDDLEQLAANKEVAAYAHPPWLLSRFKKAYPQQWRELCTANNQQAPMTLRVNQRQLSRAAYLNHLEAAGIQATPSQLSPWGIQLEQPQHPANLPGFAEGWFSVQDAAAQLAAHLLDVADGQRVLDACCAPGGKTAHLAEVADLNLTALDIDAQRLLRVSENLERLGLSAQVKCADAAQPETWWQGEPYARILLDAPCSATGVIRRHPDIKLLRRETDLIELARIQEQLLHQLWPLLEPGGKLLYATCSVLPEENQQPLHNFLYATPNAKHLPISAPGGQAQRLGLQFLPQVQGQDGFFYCLLQKTATSA